MSTNKVVFGDETLIDISNDTVTPENLFQGETAHDSNGEQVTGTFPIGEVDTQSDLIEQIKANLVGKAVGSGSGIIDVTELPTSNINSNAVYRLTENLGTTKADVWVVKPNEETGKLEVINIEDALGECEIHVINTIEETVTTESDIFQLNVLITDGVAYLLLPDIGVPLPLGSVILGVDNLDKGFTQDPYAETEIGIYTTLENPKDIVRYYIYNGVWREISAYVEYTNYRGDLDHEGEKVTDIEVLSGDVTSRVLGAGDIISGEIEKLREYHFLKRNGTYATIVRESLFRGTDLSEVTLPSTIKVVDGFAFQHCRYLQDVIFKGKPQEISVLAFHQCDHESLVINVPWSEGEVSGAPWGADGATIRYNYTGG